MANNRGYKRSWKNYLLDPNYQLRFTFTMMGVAMILMFALGWWVQEKATRATEVALNQIDGIRCPEVLVNNTGKPEVPGEVGDTEEASREETRREETNLDVEEESELTEKSEGLRGDARKAGERKRSVIQVEIDDSQFQINDSGDTGILLPVYSDAEIAESRVKREQCQASIATKKAGVDDRKNLITILMVLSGVLLMIGLGIYGIKTTHRVAGPLFKVGLYLNKLEKGIYDEVYNLRKGDQLMEFYEHFKAGHAGLTTMQEEDRDRLREAIALAKEAKLEGNTEMATVLSDMERLLEEKEASLGKK